MDKKQKGRRHETKGFREIEKNEMKKRKTSKTYFLEE